MSKGAISVYDDGDFARVEYVAELIEKHLLDGMDTIELQSNC